MTDEIKIYPRIGEREVHMVGEYVGVCWNLEKETTREPACDKHGKQIGTMPIETWKRATSGWADTKPYIVFLRLRTDRTSGELYEDEDSPVKGGLSRNCPANCRRTDARCGVSGRIGGQVSEKLKDDKPTGKWRCRACRALWDGSELLLYPQSTRNIWTCANLLCGAICDPVRSVKEMPKENQ